MALKELLTQEPTSDQSPLFPTAAALSKIIVTQKNSSYSNERSVSTLIGFIFCGKRSCPKALREMIIKATVARLANMPLSVQKTWIERVEKAIDLLNQEVSESFKKYPHKDKSHFETLLEHIETSETIFIITPSTSEQEVGIKRAEIISRLLLKKLGLYQKNSSVPKTQYWFLLPNRRTAEAFWNNFREKTSLALYETGDTSNIDERIAFLEENKFLQVYVVPSFVCSDHFVIFNPEHTRNCTSFFFSYSSNDGFNPIPLDNFSITQWKENVFNHFRSIDPETKERFASETAAIEFMKKNPNQFAGYRCPPPFIKK